MRRLWIPAALLVLVTGCGGSATVTGKVTYQGRAVLSGYVILVNEDGTAASGVIQPDGTYAVEGVKRGHVRIGVSSPDPAHAHSILNAGRKDEHTQAKDSHGPSKAGHARTKPGTDGWYPLPAALGDPHKSGLACDVSGSRVRYDIDAK
jgi:hypothetical protein